MLHVLQFDAQPTPDGVLRAMFAARKRVFVDLLKWDVPVLDGRYEIDQFDDEHACYLVLTDHRGGHLGSARLLPTTRPHLLDSLYDHLCSVTPPRGGDIWEVSRFCLDRGLRASERRAVRDTLVMALADHAFANGIARYTAIAEMGWFQQILTFGWRCRPLGLPQMTGGATLIALDIEITAETPGLLAAAGIVARPMLFAGAGRAAA
ncbi:GNAT family N-acetyltransferase [Sphingomonas cannabina]|uniref:acyl-homoserine-lactone synthase n=1 Tax=Sphingomonas cannabina TaxID=2899123 RepID=UPI001F20AAFB|nr:acyl-homoserine-lactone synthase [Sphingomonas cannabina]UIJ46349.1 GNAT family N-acetyltransferase [Sphingomonas cannabina]